MTTWATVITDASYSDRDNKAGWAAWINIDGMSYPIKKYGSFSSEVNTSTDAEIKAALNGMWIARKYGADAILLQTDCMAVIHLVTGFTKKPKLVSDWNCKIEAAGLLGVKIRAKHVKGHTNTKNARSHVNRWCDTYANKARTAKP
jgi:ribonuclease HI